MRVLVTGALGYIGSQTCVNLIEAGHKVIGVDDLSNSSVETIDAIEKITGKRIDFHQLNVAKDSFVNYFEGEGISFDSVIHFAAFKLTNESLLYPNSYYENNLASIINIMKLYERVQFKSFVFSSSCIVYGDKVISPVGENASLEKRLTPYGNTKRLGEEILEDYSSLFGLNVVSLRYFNPIGAHTSGLIGEKPKGVPANLLPYVCEVAAGKREHLKIFGDDYDTPDGTAIRDFIHVDDLAQAHIAALDYKNNNGTHYNVFNVGTGQGYSVMEVVKKFELVNSIEIPYSIEPRRNGDIEKIFADTTKVESVLGWKSKLNLEDMLESAWRFQKHSL